LVLGSLCFSSLAPAQGWPDKPVRLVGPFSAGGGTDAVARIIGPKLADALGQPVTVDNRPGAGGMIGTEIVAKAAADGYTLLLAAAGPTTIAPHIYAKDKVPFDTLRDFLPITLIGTVPFIVTVNPSLPVKTLPELIAYAKANPDKLNFGSSGNGGSPHLAGELFKQMAGIQMVHIPYKGLAPAITDLLGGQIQLVFADVGLVAPHIKGDKLRGLAATSSQRATALPDLPTVSEAGVPGYQAATWYGLVAPAGIPSEIAQRLSGEMTKILAMADVREQLVAKGMEVPDMTMAQYGELVRSDYNKWQKLVKEVGVKVD